MPPPLAATLATDPAAAPGVRFYGRALSFFRPDLPLVGLLVALIWLSLAAGVVEGAVVFVLTDAILSAKDPTTWLGRLVLAPMPADRASRVIGLAVLWLLVRLTNDTLLLVREMVNHRLRFNGTARVRRALFDHLQTLSPAYHKSRPQGDAIYRVGTDSLGFFGVLDTFVGAANSVLTVFVIGGVMAGFNIAITAVCLAMTPGLVAANLYFGRNIRRTSAQSKQADTDLTTFVQRAMATVSLAQLFGRQRTESARFAGVVDRTVNVGMSMSWQIQLFPWSQRVLYAVGHAFVLGYGGWLVFSGHVDGAGRAMTVGGVTAMLVYLGQLWEPVRRMAGFTAEVQN
ncbi:MAG TPA: ABC transporter ATP-binding protein, partial [Humisphaera sp.]